MFRRDPTVINVVLLAVCQALAMTSMTMNMTVTALAGKTLALDESLSTLPLALQFTATMGTTIPASLYMKRVGRKMGFLTGVTIGIVGAVIALMGLFDKQFLLFCFGSMLIGSFQGFAILYRYAAADTASEAFKTRAISLVMAGGLVAAIAGPELSKLTFDFSPVEFAGTFIAIIVVQGLSYVFLMFVKIPMPSEEERASSGRPILEIVKQPVFLIAIAGAMVGYGSMTFVMTATPLAMIACGFTFPTAASVIQWHVVGMFGPSFFTGSLIKRFGVYRVMLAGIFCYLLTIVFSVTSIELVNFYVGLILLGIGWNFLFIGGTSLLTQTYRPEEKAKVQGIGDFLIFSCSTAAAFASGAINHHFGWESVNFGILPLVILVGLALVWQQNRTKNAALAK